MTVSPIKSMSVAAQKTAKQKVAVIGSGISGLSCAWLLAEHSNSAYEVSLFEADARIGGHTNTVDIELEGIRHGVDTGFLVFNDWTYPNLIALFAHLNIQTAPSEMSFSVSLRHENKIKLEWSGCNLATVFAQPSNLASPKFLGMLRDLLRFNKQATALIDSGTLLSGTLGEFLDVNGYGQAFRDWYLRPMAACIWSTPSKQIAHFPLQSFLTFCRNHGLLSVNNRPQWRTVTGGARNYATKLAEKIPVIRCNAAITAVRPATTDAASTEHATIVHSDGEEQFNHIVMACHSDQALALLATPSARQQQILGAIKYHPNVAVLHTDTRLLPERKRAWAAWNYLAPYEQHGGDVSLSYLINRLQPLPFKQAVVVTLNPPFEPAADKSIARINYAHPVYLPESVAAQRDLPQIQGEGGLWFAGAWTRYGFHEDGLRAGIAVAQALGATTPWSTNVQPANTLNASSYGQ
jgi:uncharacterized protein